MDLSFGLEEVPVLLDGSSTGATFPQFQVTSTSLFARCRVQPLSLNSKQTAFSLLYSRVFKCFELKLKQWVNTFFQ